jgi:hypothetical protein
MASLPDPIGRAIIEVERHDRNMFERVLRGAREVVAIVALILASVLMALLLATLGSLASRWGDSGGVVGPAPEPGVSGCPFGEGQCGG